MLYLRQYREWLKHVRFELILCHTTVFGLIARIYEAHIITHARNYRKPILRCYNYNL